MRVTTEPKHLQSLYHTRKWHLADHHIQQSKDLLECLDDQLNILGTNSVAIKYLKSSSQDLATDSLHSGFIISGGNIMFSYYRFANDDKYFLECSDNLFYQDSDAYVSHYSSFPCLASSPRIIHRLPVTSHGGTPLLLMSRRQYGHFLYDDLLPVLSYLITNVHAHSYIMLMCSCKWQYRATSELLSILGLRIPLMTMDLPHYSSLLGFSNATFVTPSYPACLLPCFNSVKQTSSNIDSINSTLVSLDVSPSIAYLSRDGFDDSQPRVANRRQILGLLVDGLRAVHIRPQDYSETALHRILAPIDILVTEPGTLPLIAGVHANQLARVLVLLSSRCLSECKPEYFYSGWRYHTPFVTQVEYIWCKPVACNENPFSDIVYVPCEWLLSRILSKGARC